MYSVRSAFVGIPLMIVATMSTTSLVLRVIVVFCNLPSLLTSVSTFFSRLSLAFFNTSIVVSSAGLPCFLRVATRFFAPSLRVLSLANNSRQFATVNFLPSIDFSALDSGVSSSFLGVGAFGVRGLRSNFTRSFLGATTSFSTSFSTSVSTTSSFSTLGSSPPMASSCAWYFALVSIATCFTASGIVGLLITLSVLAIALNISSLVMIFY